jgi:tetratricopeptide (TPR) repeat protein
MMGVPKVERQREVARLLPGALNSLADHIESGFGFDHAISLLIRESDDELSRAFEGFMQELMSHASTMEQESFYASLSGLRREALLNMARCVDVPDVTTFVNVAIQAEQLGGPNIVEILRTLSMRMVALNEVEADLENMRAAWIWAVERSNYAAIERAIETLYWLFHSRRRYQEAETLFQLAREGLAPQPGEKPHPVWAKIVARYPDPAEDHKAQIERSLAIAREHNDRAEIAYCLYALGNVTAWAPPPETRDLDEGIAYYQQSLSHYRELGDKFYLAEVLGRIGWCYQFMGQQDNATKFARESLDLSLETGDRPVKGGFPFVPPGDDDA